MIEKMFLLPQLKRCVFIPGKLVYTSCHTTEAFRSLQTSGKSQSFIENFSNAQFLS